MKRLIIRSLVMLAMVPGCVNVVTPFDAPRVGHVVICWLKEPGNATHRQQLIDDSRAFMGIPGVMDVSAGTPLPTTRPAVDSSFDVAIVMMFRDEQALSGYVQHPAHQQAMRQTLQPLVQRYVVYDFRK